MNVKITFSDNTTKTLPYNEWVSQKDYCKKHKIKEYSIIGFEFINDEYNDQNNNSQRPGNAFD